MDDTILFGGVEMISNEEIVPRYQELYMNLKQLLHSLIVFTAYWVIVGDAMLPLNLMPVAWSFKCFYISSLLFIYFWY